MSEPREEQRARTGRRLRLGFAGLSVVGAVAVALVAARLFFPYPVGPEQPIPFSHYIHAGEREISCLFCHDTADRSANAGMPSEEKCLLCHHIIIHQFPPIRKLHDYNMRGESIPWVRVYQLPDYAHFNHQMHLNAGKDCGECHGDVKHMDRIQVVLPIEMGKCIDCHRKNDAPVDCTICHY